MIPSILALCVAKTLQRCQQTIFTDSFWHAWDDFVQLLDRERPPPSLESPFREILENQRGSFRFEFQKLNRTHLRQPPSDAQTIIEHLTTLRTMRTLWLRFPHYSSASVEMQQAYQRLKHRLFDNTQFPDLVGLVTLNDCIDYADSCSQQVLDALAIDDIPIR